MFNIWTNLLLFLMELFIKKGGDVMIDINVHFQKAYMHKEVTSNISSIMMMMTTSWKFLIHNLPILWKIPNNKFHLYEWKILTFHP
jgi:hypothetical protein